MNRAKLSFVAVSLFAFAATLGACTTESKKTADAAKAVKPMADTDLARWLSDPASIRALQKATSSAIPGSRFATLATIPGTPSEILRATISEIDPQDVRLAGVKTAELLHASLTKKQLATFVKTCVPASGEITDDSSFGCPNLYLGYNKAARQSFESVSFFNEGAANEAYENSISAALQGLQTSGLEPLIPPDDAQTKYGELFEVAGVFPNLRYDENPSMASLSNDGLQLATTYYSGGPIEVRNLATGDIREFRVADTATRSYFTAGVFSPDGTKLLGEADGLVVVWDTATRTVLFTQSFPSRTNATSRLGSGNMNPVWSPDGKYVITEAGLDTVVWDTTTWKPFRKHAVAHQAAWSPDSLHYVLIGIDDRPISAEIYESESKSTELSETPKLPTSMFSLAIEKSERDTVGVHTLGQFTSDGKYVVLLTNDSYILWNLASGKQEPVKNSAEVRSTSFEPLGYRFPNPNGSGSIIVSSNAGGWSADGHRVAGFSNSEVTVYSDVLALR
jgi:WD40-like Beta Propeller Repeat